MFTRSQDDKPQGAPRAEGLRDPSRGGNGQKSVLASDITVSGIIATEGALEVHGVVDGEIAATTLVVGHEGSVAGSVRAGQADIRGRLSGDISTASLTLRAAAQMKADASCETLIIESGAWVEGQFSRPEPPPAPEKPAPQPAAAAKPAAPAEAKADDAAKTDDKV